MSPAAVPEPFECRPLAPADRERFCALIAEAFELDPSMAYFFGPSGGDADEAFHRRALAGFVFDKALALGETVEGAFEGGRLAACAVVEPRASGPGALGALRLIPAAIALSKALPRGSLGRMNRFAAFARRPLASGRWRYLTMIGSSPAYRGRGGAAALLERAIVAARLDRSCQGLALDTENPDNLPYYGRRGFELHSSGEFKGFTIYRMIHRSGGEA